MIDEINSTELHTCLLEITLLPLAHYWHFWYGPLDVDAMRQAASYLVGTHDFKSFATAKPVMKPGVHTVKTLRHRASVFRKDIPVCTKILSLPR